MISVSMSGGSIAQRLEWLQPEQIPDGMTQADFNTFKAFGFDPNKVH